MGDHPGPQPQPLEFPFGEARRFACAAEALADEVALFAEQARCALAHAAMGFRGSIRAEVDADFDALVGALGVLRAQLDEQAGRVGDAVRSAERARADREAQIERWRRDMATYEAEQPVGVR
jgi:hypothetical protein